MDLKIPSQAASTGAVSSPLGDLLPRLRAAGTLEAEVVRLLKDNQLLLSSRLGQIRTSNSLGYRVGDRIEARLDESSGQAVLKTRRADSKPTIIDGRQNPDLMRALPPDRPLLARVVRLLAREAEIRLPDLVMRIARAPEFKPGQLLHLERNDRERRIEIRPLQDKTMYRAIVRQLLPSAVQQRGSALVSLLNFAAAVRAEQTDSAQPRAAAREGGSSADFARAGAAGGNPAGRTRATVPSGPPPRLGDSTGAAPGPAPNPAGEPGAAGGRDLAARTVPPAAGRAAAGGHGVDTAVLRAPGAAAAGPEKTAATRPAGIETRATKAPVSPPVDGRANRSGPSPTARATTATAGAASDAAAAGTRGGAGHATNAGQTGLSTVAGRKMIHAATPGMPVTMAVHAPAATMPPTLPALEPLLQLVRQLADIDAPQVRKWFEFARFVRTAADTPRGAVADLWHLLRPLGNGETFGRELARALAKKPGARGDAESAGVRASQAEVSPAQLREGLRLVEQSLAQNLLQRASLGLQQDTQQPLNLSLAIPFIDQQQIRPLSIDLRQRKQADDPARRSWEIRLGFELGELGCISCHLLLEGSSVAASFYSERATTRDRIETELPRLRRQLLRAGFEPGEFHSFAGKPAVSPVPGADDFAESLIDIEA